MPSHGTAGYGRAYGGLGSFGGAPHPHAAPPAYLAAAAPSAAPAASPGWVTSVPAGKESDRIHLQMMFSSPIEYRNWRHSAQISIVTASRDPSAASLWVAETIDFQPIQLVARYDPAMAGLDVKLLSEQFS